MGKFFTKLFVSVGASLTVTESVNLDAFWNALITLAVSVLTVLTVEGVAWLRAWFKARTPKQDKDAEHKQELEEADGLVEVAQEEHKKEE